MSTFADLQILTEAEFQAANFKLRSREYKYYYEANKDRLDAIPELSDMSGGLSNPALFNFVYYCVWKSAYTRLPTEELQQRFSEHFGDALLDNIAPDARRAVAADQCSQSAARCAAACHLQPARMHAMLAAMRHVLSHVVSWSTLASVHGVCGCSMHRCAEVELRHKRSRCLRRRARSGHMCPAASRADFIDTRGSRVCAAL